MHQTQIKKMDRQASTSAISSRNSTLHPPPPKQPLNNRCCCIACVVKICSSEYCVNKYNLLRILSLLLTFALLIVTFLYSVGAVYQLTLSRCWCDDAIPLSWDEIVDNSISQNTTIGAGGCWKSKLAETDDELLFGSIYGGFETAVARINPESVTKLILFGLVFIGLLSLFIGYFIATLKDCKKTIKNEWGMNKKEKIIQVYIAQPIDDCCSKNLTNFWQKYTNIYDWYNKFFGYKTPGTIMQLILKEFIEIGIQNIAFYFYAGSQHPVIHFFNNTSESGSDEDLMNETMARDNILSVRKFGVLLFAWFLTLDCIVLSIMWSLYVFKNKFFNGEFFVFIMFVIDCMFDLFYALYPLTLIETEAVSFAVIVGSLNSSSIISFVSVYIPMIWLTWKLWEILDLLTILSKKEFNKIFRKSKFGMLRKNGTLRSRSKSRSRSRSRGSFRASSSRLGLGNLVKNTIDHADHGEHEAQETAETNVEDAVNTNYNVRDSGNESNGSGGDIEIHGGDEDSVSNRSNRSNSATGLQTRERIANNLALNNARAIGLTSVPRISTVSIPSIMANGDHDINPNPASTTTSQTTLTPVKFETVGNDFYDLAMATQNTITTTEMDRDLVVNFGINLINTNFHENTKNNRKFSIVSNTRTREGSIEIVDPSIANSTPTTVQNVNINSNNNNKNTSDKGTNDENFDINKHEDEECEVDEELICCPENSCSRCPKRIKNGCNICCHGPTCLTRIPFYDENEGVFIVQYLRRISLIVISLLWFLYATYIISTTLIHFNTTIDICEQHSNQLNVEYPQLFVWPYCTYKVYPPPQYGDLPCNCRFVIAYCCSICFCFFALFATDC